MAQQEQQQVQQQQQQPSKSKRDLFSERLKKKYPDREYADDEALYSQANDDYDEYDKQIGSYKEHEKAFSDLFSADPRSAAFLTDWRKGGDPVTSLVRMFGTDIKEALDDPEKQEAIAEANKEYLARVAKNKELEEEYQKNIKSSLAAIDELQAKNGLTDDQVDDALSFLMKIVNDGILGKFTPESIDMAMKAINHDTDVQTAGEEGMIAGKNTRAEMQLRKPKRGDGTPQLTGSNNAPTRRRTQQSIFDLADEAK